MPEHPPSKVRPHPLFAGRTSSLPGPGRAGSSGPAYAELAVTSNFTFLTGASHPEELVERAAELGHAAAAIADTNTLAGIVRAHVAARETGIPLAVGCRLRLTSGLSILAYPTCRDAYARLCRLLTLGKRRAPKGECRLTLDDLPEHQEGLLACVVPPERPGDAFVADLARLRGIFDGDRLSLGAAAAYGPDDARRLARLAALGEHAGVPLAAVNDAHYHEPSRRPLQDVLTCVRHGCTVEEAGLRLHANAERHLKPGVEMARLFARYPAALARSVEIAGRAAAFSLDELRYEYPAEDCPGGLTPTEYLAQRTWAGAAWRYPGGVPEKVRKQLRYELALIAELGYEPYFLTCAEIVDFAREKGILCQGRGGAANSAVCYCLRITAVDPAKFSLLFERFVSRERKEPPDIDIDFEHERREEVIQHLYRRYGRDRAALTAEVIAYRGRSAVRDVGKAMGLSLDCVDALARQLDHWGEAASPQRIAGAGLSPDDPTLARVIALCGQLAGFPRHLSQHVGGFVITRSPLCELVPIENAAMDDRTVIEWDKDDIDAMGMLKVDVLGLGMLTCVGKCLELVNQRGGVEVSRCQGVKGEAPSTPRHLDTLTPPLSLDSIPGDDSAVYAMIQRADTVGVFQIESRAQMSMLPRLRPACFYDLVIEVAIVRPGPIQGKMVHPYLRRRNGEEPVTFPSPDVERVLGRTLGVPLFQEQAMQLAIVAAGFTPDEADALRRAMAAWKRKGKAIERFGERLVEGMIARGYGRDFAERCFEQIKGFSEYGFPESHAASFAILVYVSAWLKLHHPAAFAAALINSQPMGFYQPAQIVRDAREHGVEVRPVDVNISGWDCGLEAGVEVSRCRGVEGAESGVLPSTPRHPDTLTPCLRLGTRLVKGLREADGELIAGAVARHGPFTSIDALRRACPVPVAALRALARADAFGSMRITRQEALWAVRALRDEPMPLFDAADPEHERLGGDALPAPAPRTRVLHDYEFTGLTLREHPLSFLRGMLSGRGVIPAGDLRDVAACPQGRRVVVAGIVLIRQRPATASGIVFMTLEDETGISNIIVWPQVFERFRAAARLSTTLLVRGRVERQGEVVHVRATAFESLDGHVPTLASISRDFH